MQISGGVAYRIRKGEFVAVEALCVATPVSLTGRVVLAYDSGHHDRITFPTTSLALGANGLAGNQRAKEDGWVIGLFLHTTTPIPESSVWCQVLICFGEDASPASTNAVISEGYLGGFRSLMLGANQPLDYSAIWVFQGTVQEDNTVGTHVCTLTVTIPSGSSAQLLFGQIIMTGAAGLQANAQILDPTGVFELGQFASATSAGILSFPYAAAAGGFSTSAGSRILTAGCQLVLTATTSTVSDTQTFSCALAIKGLLPTAVLADNTGTPTLTTNVSGVF